MSVRLRFAPSPTGPLHIGGARTALYNYLFARKHGGQFILRVEDTDQNRFVPGAEQYILNSLRWLGLELDESVEKGGPYGPYRQSDRKEIYKEYAAKLVESGGGYYAFDSEEELKALRDGLEKQGQTFKYDATTRKNLNNSLNLPAEEVQRRLAEGHPYVIRLKVPENSEVRFSDVVRGEVSYQSKDLDDKVMMKADGMPTYHLANVVDDRLMRITHVVRGEEWLPSTPTHVLLYRAFGWEAEMPQFVHLPLLLKPTGKGKLSKRDGIEGGFPVFPLDWVDPATGTEVKGFKGYGFLPEATLNFLALLGWNPGTEQEIFSLEELVQAFSLEKIGNTGAQFDVKKAEWFNQQYIHKMPEGQLLPLVRAELAAHGHNPSDEALAAFIHMYRERVTYIPDFYKNGYYLLEDLRGYDEAELEKKVMKKWDSNRKLFFESLAEALGQAPLDADALKTATETLMAEQGLGTGDVFPFLRLALSGTLQGPPIFEVMVFLGHAKTAERIVALAQHCAAKQ